MKGAWLILLLLAPLSSAAFSINPELRLSTMYYFDYVSPDVRAPREIFSLKAPSSERMGSSWKMRVDPNLSADPNNASISERYFVDPKEAYLQWQDLPFTVQAGWNTFTWGDTDVYNPLDVVNQRRYADPLLSEKLGALNLFFRWEPGPFSVEGLYIPVQRESILPGVNSRWLPRTVYESRSIGTSFGPATILLPSDINYSYVSPAVENDALANNFGARIKGRLSGFDFSLIGFSGAASAPAVSLHEITATVVSYYPSVKLSVAPDVSLQATYYKVQVGGGSFALVLGDFLLKGASAYVHTVSRGMNLPNSGFDHVLSLERSFDLGKSSLTVMGEGTYAYHHDSIDNGSTSLSRMFDEASLLGLRYSWQEKWTFLASYLKDIKYRGDFLLTEGTYRATDAFALDLQGNFLGGAEGTPLGTYQKNSRMIFSVIYNM